MHATCRLRMFTYHYGVRGTSGRVHYVPDGERRVLRLEATETRVLGMTDQMRKPTDVHIRELPAAAHW